MRLTDNTCYTSHNVPLSQKFLNAIANKTVKELAEEGLFVFPPNIFTSDDLDVSHLVIRTTDKHIFTSNVMGVMKYKNEHLFIGSRFDQRNDYFFYYMLKRVFKVNIITLENEINKEFKYLDLLVLLFSKYLNEAMKKGLYKEYQVFHYNDMNLKGVIDFKKHIKNNMFKPGAISYHTREFSYENKVIHLIRYTIEFLKRNRTYYSILTQNEVTRENIKNLEKHSSLYKSYQMNDVIHQNIIKPVRQSYFIEYRRLQTLCIEILRNETVSFTKNSKEKISGVLFDGAWLFEEYVNTIIGDHFDHPSNRIGSGREYLFDGGRGHIYPDFLSKNYEEMSVADAKYKPINNIRGRDYLQIVAYMHRFEAKRGYFIYPEAGEQNHRNILNLLSGMKKESMLREDTKVIRLGVLIPNNVNSFTEFEKQMKTSEEYIQQLCGVTIKK